MKTEWWVDLGLVFILLALFFGDLNTWGAVLAVLAAYLLLLVECKFRR